VEYATLAWVAWFNQQRLMEGLGYVPPAEHEEHFHRQQEQQQASLTPPTVAGALKTTSLL
jgi:hypothetical protein